MQREEQVRQPCAQQGLKQGAADVFAQQELPQGDDAHAKAQAAGLAHDVRQARMGGGFAPGDVQMRQPVVRQQPHDLQAVCGAAQAGLAQPGELVRAAIQETVVAEGAGMWALEADIQHCALAQLSGSVGVNAWEIGHGRCSWGARLCDAAFGLGRWPVRCAYRRR